MERHYSILQEEPISENLENPGIADPGPAIPPSDYLDELKGRVRQAQSDADHARFHSEKAHTEIGDLKRKTNRNSGITFVMLLALLAAGVYGYYQLNGRESSLLADMPGVQKALDGLGRRVSGTEGQLRSWASKWDGLADRVGGVEKSVSENLRAAKDFATTQASRVQQQMLGEMNNRTQAIDAKLNKLEAAQQKDHAQLATLEQQVGNARDEARTQLASAQQENSREFGDVRTVMNQNRDGLDAVVRNLDRERVDFEVSKKQSRELAPGLAFTVLKTNVAQQRVDGYLHLIPEGRFLWIHDQGIGQPMLFHIQKDGKRSYEVTFTRVGQNSAVGYVLMPRWSSAELPAAGGAAAQPNVASLR